MILAIAILALAAVLAVAHYETVRAEQIMQSLRYPEIDRREEVR